MLEKKLSVLFTPDRSKADLNDRLWKGDGWWLLPKFVPSPVSKIAARISGVANFCSGKAKQNFVIKCQLRIQKLSAPNSG